MTTNEFSGEFCEELWRHGGSLERPDANALTRSTGYPKVQFMTVDQMEETGEYGPELIEYLRKHEVGAIINKGELPSDNNKNTQSAND